MKSSILEILEVLEPFGSERNKAHIKQLAHMAHKTNDDIVRDQSLDLLLYCQEDEYGPLGMRTPDDVRRSFAPK